MSSPTKYVLIYLLTCTLIARSFVKVILWSPRIRWQEEIEELKLQIAAYDRNEKNEDLSLVMDTTIDETAAAEKGQLNLACGVFVFDIFEFLSETIVKKFVL